MHTHARKKEQFTTPKSVRAPSTSSSPRAHIRKEPSALRYAAYDASPAFAQQSKPKRQESFNSLESYASVLHKGGTLLAIKGTWQTLSPDMVDLAQSVAGGSSRSVSPVVRREVRSPFPLLAKQTSEMMESRSPCVHSHRRQGHIKIWWH